MPLVTSTKKSQEYNSAEETTHATPRSRLVDLPGLRSLYGAPGLQDARHLADRSGRPGLHRAGALQWLRQVRPRLYLWYHSHD